MIGAKIIFTYILAALGIVGGVLAVGWSLTARIMTGEHAAILAVAAFTFAIALGVWRGVGILEEYADKQKLPAHKGSIYDEIIRTSGTTAADSESSRRPGDNRP